ncbi:MAG: hypothetical protein ACI4TU_10700, partial [Candidatus Cryptobacteroides sp.]
ISNSAAKIDFFDHKNGSFATMPVNLDKSSPNLLRFRMHIDNFAQNSDLKFISAEQGLLILK